MKINFEGSENKTNKTNHAKAKRGNFESMLKERKQMLPEIEKSVNEILKDYSGEMLAIIRVHEDENGEPTSSSIFVGGVAGLDASKRMVEALEETRKDVVNSIVGGITDNPELLNALLNTLPSNILSDILKKGKK